MTAHRIVFITQGADEIARTILASLPEWLGRPDALTAYVEVAARLPT